MTDERKKARTASSDYCNALLRVKEAERVQEVAQLLIDVLDIVEQSDVEVRVLRAHRAFWSAT